MSPQSQIWSHAQLAPWLEALRSGEVAAAPAEGMYGYVADPFRVEALQGVLEAKNRAPTKGYIVLLSSLHDLPRFCPTLPDTAISAIQTHWKSGMPATTLVLPALPSLPPLLTGGLPTIALRLPQVGYVQEYMKAANMPLVSTSLNISGQSPALTAAEIPAGLPALTLDQPLSGTPSRIYNPVEDIWLR